MFVWIRVFTITKPMIFKTYKTLNFLNKTHSSVIIKSTFEVLSTARFTNAVSLKQPENTTPENVPINVDPKDIELKVTEVVGKQSAQNLKAFFKPRKPHAVGVSFVWDSTCAKKIVEKVLKNVKSDNCVVLETSPGFGFTTLNFLESGVPKVYIFQGPFSATKFYEKYSDKFVICQHSIFHKHGLQDDKVLDIIEEAIKSGKICKIFGVTTHHKFLSSLPRQVMHKNLWDLCDSTEFYVIVSEQVYSRITNYRLSVTRYFTYCLFSFLFDIECLATYPTSAFLPVLQTNAMYLVRITKKKKETMELSERLLPEYVTFLKILGSNKSNLIIKTLEQWVPGCGLNFISQGIRLTTEVKDLSAKEALTLFKIFTECEGYENFRVMHKVLENEEKERKGK